MTKHTIKSNDNIIVSISVTLIVILLTWVASSTHSMAGNMKVVVTKLEQLETQVNKNETRIHALTGGIK